MQEKQRGKKIQQIWRWDQFSEQQALDAKVARSLVIAFLGEKEKALKWLTFPCTPVGASEK